MEIVTLITAALVAGATASLKKVGGDLIQSAYEKLKAAVIARTQRKSTVEALEEDPGSEGQRQVVEDVLRKSGAQDDRSLADLAVALNDAIAKLGAADRAAIGVDLRILEAGNVTLRNISATGTGVKGDRWTLAGDLTIDGVDAGAAKAGSPPAKN